MEHRLKIDSTWAERVRAGEKLVEVCIHDRDFQAGDIVVLTEVSAPLSPIRAEILHVLPACLCEGIEDGYCLLSIRALSVSDDLSQWQEIFPEAVRS